VIDEGDQPMVRCSGTEAGCVSMVKSASSGIAECESEHCLWLCVISWHSNQN
jgi:hypothetical protein